MTWLVSLLFAKTFYDSKNSACTLSHTYTYEHTASQSITQTKNEAKIKWWIDHHDKVTVKTILSNIWKEINDFSFFLKEYQLM